MVINHNSGADEEETNPLDGEMRWTKFSPKSGRFPRDWNCFHPSRYERVMIEGEKFAGFPHLCHRNPRVYAAMFEYARMAIEELDFDGFRFDFVKGFGPWMIGVLAKYQYQKKNGSEFTPFVVGRVLVGARGYRRLVGCSSGGHGPPDCCIRLSPAVQAEERLRYTALRSPQPD